MGLLSGVLNLLFPPKCLFCRRVLSLGETSMCPECWENQLRKSSEKRGTFFYRCVISLDYDDAVRGAIHRFKFGDQPGYAEVFGEIIAHTVKKALSGQYDIITWIPVSEKRLKERGYDQGMLLADSAAKKLGHTAVATLKKTKHNPAQSSQKDAKGRKSNVKGVYSVPEPEKVAGKRVLLVDDVITTGATMEEAARTLLRAGASLVVCAALAHPEKS